MGCCFCCLQSGLGLRGALCFLLAGSTRFGTALANRATAYTLLYVATSDSSASRQARLLWPLCTAVTLLYLSWQSTHTIAPPSLLLYCTTTFSVPARQLI